MRRAFGGGVRELHQPPNGHPMRFTCPRILLVLTALVAVGCSDQPAAPVAASSEDSPFLKVYPTYSADGRSADIIVEPSGGYFALGKHVIWFGANSICDPTVSTYGVTEWDKACTPITEPIHIHAELREQDGRTWIDFSPELRFVPSLDEQQWVYLFMRTHAAEGKFLTGKNAPPILWSPAIGIPGIDESLLDETLKTKWDRRLGGVYRRIKHFSGYNVYSGRSGSAAY